MRQELENIQYIEKYLEGALEFEDKQKFEQHLEENLQFKQDVLLQIQIIQNLKEEAFLKNISEFHHQYINQSPKDSFPATKYILWVLLFALLGAAIWKFTTSFTTEPNPLKPQQEIIPTKPVLTTENVKPDYRARVATLQAFQTPFNAVRLYGAATIRLEGSNSILSIPKNALVDRSGKVIKGAYELKYRLINDLSARSFYPIDMQYKKAEENYRFTGAAIFEIQAFKNGDTLSLAPGKSMSLDFETIKRNTALQLFYYDKKQQIWEATAAAINYHRRGSFEEKVDSVRYRAALADFETKQAAKNKVPQRDGKTIDLGSTALMPEGIQKLPEAKRPLPNQYLVKHFYNPKIIKDLELRSFGAYNLSELYKVQNQVAIEADYLDEKGNRIDDAYLLTVIDLNFDAAYSFKPKEFICNTKANNVLILWTKSGKIYSFVKRATVQLKTGNYSFNMQDLSSSVKSIDDLKKYLRFVRKATKKNVTNR